VSTHTCRKCRVLFDVAAAGMYPASRKWICRWCISVHISSRRGDREPERRKRAEKAGRVYVPRRLYVKRPARRELRRSDSVWTSCDWSVTPKWLWVERLKDESPAEAQAGSQEFDALAWRARYALDAEFRAKVIERTHQKKTNGEMTTDGSMTGSAVRAMFAAATVCPYCDRSMTSRQKTLDHIWPRSRGGVHSTSNSLVCCHSCNSRKKDMAPESWLLRLTKSKRSAVLQLYREICGGDPWQSPMPLEAA
jgi:5-methylcytosine-specific restriction endonuclease McrA